MKKIQIFIICFFIFGIFSVFAQNKNNSNTDTSMPNNRYDESTWKLEEIEDADISIGNISLSLFHEKNYDFDVVMCMCKEETYGTTRIEIYLIALKGNTGKEFESILGEKIKDNNCTTINDFANLIAPIVKDKFELINQVIYNYGNRYDFIEK